MQLQHSVVQNETSKPGVMLSKSGTERRTRDNYGLRTVVRSLEDLFTIFDEVSPSASRFFRDPVHPVIFTLSMRLLALLFLIS
jgi:hypothetical protein